MLDSILRILPLLGIIFLVLLCIIIVFLLLVLFSPIRYRLSGKNDAEAFCFSVRANWLLGLLRVRYAYPQPGRLTVKVLWFTLYDSGAERQEEKKTDSKKTNERDKAKTHSETVASAAACNTENSGNIRNAENTVYTENTGNISNTGNNNNTDCIRDSRNDAANEQPKEPSENQTEEDGQDTNWISGKIEKIKFTIRSTYDKIKNIWENITYYVTLLQEEESHLLFAHVMKRLVRMLRNIRPRKLRVKILFGTGAPDTTGYAFGIYCMFSTALGSDVVVTPDFERTVLEGELDATGTITSAVLVWHFLRVVLDKKFWKFIDKLKKGKEPAGTIRAETKTTRE